MLVYFTYCITITTLHIILLIQQPTRWCLYVKYSSPFEILNYCYLKCIFHAYV